MQFERVILVIGAVGMAAVGSAACAAPSAGDAVAVCARISKKDARLECYDQVARDVRSGQLQSQPMMSAPPMQAGQPTQAAPQPNWAAPPPVVTNPGATPVPTGTPGWGAAPNAPAATTPSASSFGSEQLKSSEPERLAAEGGKSIQAEVASSSDNGVGQWRVTLADGAVWQMTESVSLFRPPAPHEMVTIRRGALGSFLMDVGKQAAVRVMRIR